MTTARAEPFWEYWRDVGERLGVDYAMLERLHAAGMLSTRFYGARHRREYAVWDEDEARVAVSLSKMGCRTWAKEVRKIQQVRASQKTEEEKTEQEAQMGMMSLTGFSGTAEVLGLLREVSWGPDGLLLKGLSQTDADAVLNALAVGTLPTFVAIGSKLAAPEARAEVGEASAMKLPKCKTCGDPLTLTAVGLFHPCGHGDAPAPAPVQVSTVNDASAVREPTAAAAPEKKKTNGAVQLTTPAAPAAAANDAAMLDSEDASQEEEAPAVNGAKYSLDALRRASTVRAVLSHLIERGYEEKSEIIAVCKQLRDQVPVLGRVADIDERIARALEVMVP